MSNTAPNNHRWTFFRAAGVTQARISTAADIVALADLKEELWTILSCPSKGLQFDQKTFDFMDFDKDGHIRVREVVLSLKWLLQRLKDPADIFKDSDEVPLTAFADTDEGKALAKAAEMLLVSIGKKDATSLTLADVVSRQTTFMNEPFNGDGVITAAATGDAAVAKLINEVIAATGGTPDRNGTPGVNAAKLDAFYADIDAHLAWLARAEKEKDTLFPFGDNTASASSLLNGVRAKIDDFFLRCRLASFDEASSGALNAADYASVAAGNITAATDKIAEFPIARVAPGAKLPLSAGVNPSWQAPVFSFAKAVVVPVFGEVDSLSEDEWRTLCAKIAPYQAWQGSVGGASVASLGEARLREIVADKKGREEILSLCARDAEHSAEINVLNDLEKFVRFHANFNRFLHNFVNFSDYYDPKFDEIFRAGNLFIDGRVCRLCIDIADMGSHATLATPSKIFLAYCEITRSQTHEKKTICALVTAGFAASLWVGRHGIFYDRKMNDWEAVVVKIVDAPISLKEAFWSPWLKISDMLNEQIKKLLSSKQDNMLGAVSSNVSTIGAGAPPAPPAKPDGAALASSVAAIGIAIGLIGSAFGALIAAVSGLSLWQTIGGVLAVFLIVSGPSVILAWFKMRARDLAPVLNACGWAVNKRLKMTLRLGREFTHEAVLPKGAKVEVGDPYAESHCLRNIFIALLVIAAGLFVCWKVKPEWINEPLYFFNLKERPAVECVAENQAPEAEAPASAEAAEAPAETPAE